MFLELKEYSYVSKLIPPNEFEPKNKRAVRLSPKFRIAPTKSTGYGKKLSLRSGPDTNSGRGFLLLD